ncbi:MAG: O-antigen ligase family protein [Phycisphaerae bacterium]|nr:O-antigen ligase family protein [Phycisphaerae bacterium]
MSAIARDSFSLGFLFLFLAGFAAAALAIPIEYIHFYWMGLAGLILIIVWALKGRLIDATLIWFFTLICLHEEFWRMAVPFFFAVTIPRLLIVVLVLLMLLMIAVGRLRVNMAWPVSGAITLIAVYFFVSAVVSGFDTRSPVTVHYRLIGGYLFPFTVFALILHGIENEISLRRIANFFMLIGAYLTFTGWMEYFQVWALVWPRFIANPEVGIHWGRVRGPFVMSAAMGLALTYCYFNNLVLLRQYRGVRRWMIYALNLLMLPIIFWTKTRSVWLGFLLCSIVWVAYSKRRTSRAVWIAILFITAAVVGVINIENFLSEDRAKGGLTDIEPIYVRLGLAQITFNMFRERPLFGVGFGHFRDYAPQFATDPSSPFYAFASSALEHNNLLSILAETGLVGIALYLALLVILARMSLALYRRLPETAVGFINRDLIVLYWILTLAYLTDGMLRETSDNPFANSLFLGLSAVIVALNSMLGRTPLERLRPKSPGAYGPSLPTPARPPSGRGGTVPASPAPAGGRG